MSAGAGAGAGAAAAGGGVGADGTCGAGSGPLRQAASTPRIVPNITPRKARVPPITRRMACAPQPVARDTPERDAALGNPTMWLILLEAFGAGLVLVLIVWWTMFSGRKRGERPPPED